MGSYWIYIKNLFIFLIIVGTSLRVSAQVKIGSNPKVVQAASLLELESQNKGLLLSRLTDTLLINALNPPNGMVVFYNSNNHQAMMVRRYNKWVDVVTADSVSKYLIATAKNITSGSSVLNIQNGVGAVIQAVVVSIDSSALGHWLTTSPLNDSLAVGLTRSPARDSINKLIVRSILTNPAIDSALAVATTNSPVKDSVISVINSTIKVANGLSKSGQTILLGGDLNQATTINTSNLFTLSIKGLPNGSASDSLLVSEANTGILKKVASGTGVKKSIILVATAGQTQFATPMAITDITKINLYRNGVLVDFTQVDANNIQVNLGGVLCSANDEIRIIQYY